MKKIKSMTGVILLSFVFFAVCAYAGGMSEIQISKEKVSPKEKDMEILRTGMIAELDAVSLYEQLAATATNPLIKKMFLDIAKEEKTHLGEFQTVLLEIDEEQKIELQKGKDELQGLRE